MLDLAVVTLNYSIMKIQHFRVSRTLKLFLIAKAVQLPQDMHISGNVNRSLNAVGQLMGAPCPCYWVKVFVCSSIVLIFCSSVKHICSSSCINTFVFQRRLKDMPASVLVRRDRDVHRELPTTARVDIAQG